MALAATKWMKFALIFFQIITFLAGLIMLIAGSVIQQQIKTQRLTHTVGGYSTQAGSIICIIFGLLVLAMSLFGLFATIKDHHRFLVFYAVVMSLVFVIQFITGITGLTVLHNSKFKGYVGEIFQKEFGYNNSNTRTKEESDRFQQMFQCCGWVGPIDWEDSSVNASGIPESCCKTVAGCDVSVSTNIWQTGCQSKIMSAVSTVIEVVCGILVTFSLFNFASIVLAAMLSKKIRTGYSYT